MPTTSDANTRKYHEFLYADIATQGSYLAIYQSCQWEVVEEVSEVFPYVRVAIFSKTLIVEAIHLCNLPTLMIATKNGNSIRKANLCVCICVCVMWYMHVYMYMYMYVCVCVCVWCEFTVVTIHVKNTAIRYMQVTHGCLNRFYYL